MRYDGAEILPQKAVPMSEQSGSKPPTQFTLHQELREEKARNRRLQGELARERGARGELTVLQKDVARLERELDLVTKIEDIRVKSPAWLAPKQLAKGQAHKAVASLLLSDLHLDEIVKPAQVEGVNAYNRKIAEMRLRRVFDKTIVIARDYLAGVDIEGMSLMLGGDIFSGNIHEELKETNEGTLLEAVDYWVDPLAAGIRMLVEHFGKVHISGVVGNHGRNTRKPAMKNRVRDNFDWLLYRILRREFTDVPEITWQISEAADTTVEVYRTKYLFTHGDQFRGGSGIAGMLSPLMLGHHRKSKRQMAVGKSFDWMVMGHWHTYFHGRGLIVNGSTKGLDEYAYTANFDFEPPQQAFWLTTPEHGVTFTAPILAQDRKKEGW